MGNGLLGEQVVLQLPGERRILAPDPLQHHRRMFLFLIAIVRKDCLEFFILARIGTLVVPINGFQLFHQRHDGSVHVARFIGQFLDGLVITDTRHGVLLFLQRFNGDDSNTVNQISRPPYNSKLYGPQTKRSVSPADSLFTQQIANLGKQFLIFRRGGRRGGGFGFLRFHDIAEKFNDEDIQRKRHDDEIHHLADEQTVRNIFAIDDELPAEVALLARQQHADGGHDDVFDERIDDLAEGGADDDTDGEIYDVALEREVLELLEQRQGFPRGCSSGERAYSLLAVVTPGLWMGGGIEHARGIE